MREIKFRGKSIKTGNFIYGILAMAEGTAYITSYNSNKRDWREWEQVDLKTAGQYVGLKDKEGKEIYEGDTVKRTSITDRWNYTGKVTFVEGAFWIEGEKQAILLSGEDDTLEIIERAYDNLENAK